MRKNRTTEENAIIMSTRVLNPQMLSLLINIGSCLFEKYIVGRIDCEQNFLQEILLMV